MKVLFDHQTFTLQEYGGISRYYYELLRNIAGIEGQTAELSIKYSNNAYLNSDPGKLGHIPTFFKGRKFKGKYRVLDLFNKIQSIRAIKKGEFDVFHPTYYDPYFLKHIGNKPFTATFLDMIHEKFAGEFVELAQDHKIYDHKKTLLQRADKVIAISQSTKNDIVEIFGVDPNKIQVIYLGSSFRKPSSPQKRILPYTYLLYVGNRGLYKNFNYFITAIQPVLKREPDLKVVCAGGGSFTPKEITLFKELAIMDQVIFQPINDNILANLYSFAEMFLFPSLYEGFGIPVLEAFACGCPCLLSNKSSLPEVAGDAAVYFDPQNEDSIRNAVQGLLYNGTERDKLIIKGIEREKQFSWEKTCLQTIELYKSIS